MERRHHRSPQAYPRTARVNALLLEVLAEEVERLADADERLALVTLTGVLCEPDLRRATVLLASLPEGAGEAFEEHRRGLQRAIASEVRLKRTPALSFAVDPAVVAGEKVEAALRRAAARPPAAWAGPSGEVEPVGPAGTAGPGTEDSSR